MWLGVQEKIIVTERARAIASLVPIGSGEEVGELLTLVQEGLAAWRGQTEGSDRTGSPARTASFRDRS